MEFLTDRCLIRKLKTDDFEAFYEMQSNVNVMRYIKAPLNYEESKKELQKFIDYYTDSSRYFLLWAIESKEGQDFLGLCGVYENEDRENEIAYRFLEKYWGMGLGKEIASGLIGHCISSLEMEEIVAFTDEGNVGSIKILEREMRFLERVYSDVRGRYSRKYGLLTLG